MVPPAKITAENHSQAVAARPRAGPETIVRLAAYTYTRVKTLVGVDNPFSDPDILDSPAH